MTLASIKRICAVTMLIFASPYVLAQYPEKPVRLIVGYTPGGATDVIARILGAELSTKWGRPVIIDNRPGASGTIAGEQTAKAEPDGYTLLLGYTPEVSINKLVLRSMRYDPITDLTPIALAAVAPLVLVSGPKLPVSDFKALMAYKTGNRPVSYGSPGNGGQQHMAGEILGKLTSLPVMHVPYRGTSAAVADLLGGQIDIFFGTIPPLLQQVRSGRLKPLLVAGDKREVLLPDVPTAVELGLPGLQLSNWFGVFGPKALPAPIREKIASDVVEALSSKNVNKALEAQGLTPRPLTGQAFRQFIDSEMVKYKGIVEQTGITAD